MADRHIDEHELRTTMAEIATSDLFEICDESPSRCFEVITWLLTDEELASMRYAFLSAVCSDEKNTERGVPVELTREYITEKLERLSKPHPDSEIVSEVQALCRLASHPATFTAFFELVHNGRAPWKLNAKTTEKPIRRGAVRHKFRISPLTVAGADAGDENARAQFTNWSAPEASGIADVSLVLKPGSGGNRTVEVFCTAIDKSNKSLTAILTIGANRIEIPLHADADEESRYVGESSISLEAGDFDLALQIDGIEMAPVS